MIKFIINYVILIFSNGIINIIELLTNTYITRKIGTAFVGSYSLIMNFFTFLITLSVFGVPLALTKLVSEKTTSNKEEINAYSKSAIKICLVTSILTTILSFIFKDNIANIILKDTINSNYIGILCLALPLISVSACICGYFNALRKVKNSAIHDIICHMSKAIIIVLFLNYTNNSYLTLILSLVLSELLAFIYTFTIYILKRDKSTKNIKCTKKILKISGPIAFTTLVRSGLSTIKHTLIPLRLQKYGFSAQYALSRYGIIHGIALPFILIPSIFINCFSSLLLPEYSRLYAKSNNEKIISYTKKSFKITLLFSLYISFILYISSDLLCYTFYSNNEVAYYVKILTPLIWIMYLDTIIDNMLRGLDLQVDVMKINIIDVLVSIALIWICVPKLGTFGYILVLYVSEYLNGFLSIGLLLKKTSLKFDYMSWIVYPLILLFISFFISNHIFKNIITYTGLISYITIFSILFFVLYLIFARKNKA